MSEFEIIGLIVAGVITLGSFVGVVLKFTQPINELRIVIQKLLDKLDSLTKDNTEHDKHLADHDEHLNKLDGRVGNLETKMEIFHRDN